MRKLEQYNYNQKRILLRVDLNVPVSNGIILDNTRIIKILPTIKYLINNNAKIIIASHFGRPKGIINKKLSLEFLSKELSKSLEQEVYFCPETVGPKAESMANALKPKEILLLENLRFHPGETKNDSEFANSLAKLADFYINDAFSCSHRAHASIVKIAEILPSAAGLLLEDEVEHLTHYLANPIKPIIALVGGSKVSTKLELLNSLIKRTDYLCIGGAMANTFLKAAGYSIGKSFYEPDLIDIAKSMLSSVILPKDAIIAKEISENAEASIVEINNIKEDQMILDIGPQSVDHINNLITKCKTIIWNGPLGVFEYPQFAHGTTNIAKKISELTTHKQLVSVAGGGDVIAALKSVGLSNKFTYISTAGGAFLEWLEGRTLPGLKALE